MDEAGRELDDLINILSRVPSVESLDELRHDLDDLADLSKSAEELAAKWLADACHD